HHHGQWTGRRSRVANGLLSRVIEAEDPERTLLEAVERATDVRDPGKGKVKEGAGRRADRGRSDRRRTAFPEDEGRRSRSLGGAGTRPQILRIGDAVQDDDERVLPEGQRH